MCIVQLADDLFLMPSMAEGTEEEQQMPVDQEDFRMPTNLLDPPFHSGGGYNNM